MEFYYPQNKLSNSPNNNTPINSIPPLSNLTKTLVSTLSSESSSLNSSPSISLWPWLSSVPNPPTSSPSKPTMTQFPVRVTLPPLVPQAKRVKVQQVTSTDGSVDRSPNSHSPFYEASLSSSPQHNENSPRESQGNPQVLSPFMSKTLEKTAFHHPHIQNSKGAASSPLFLLQEGIERDQERETKRAKEKMVRQRERELLEREREMERDREREREKDSEVTVIQKSQFCVPMYNSGNSVIQGPKGFIATHFKLPKKELKCTECHTLFKRKHLLKKHMKVHEKITQS